MNEGIIGSMKQLGVTESYKLKRQVVLSASEAAEMILRYASIILPSRNANRKYLALMTSYERLLDVGRQFSRTNSIRFILETSIHMYTFSKYCSHICDPREVSITKSENSPRSYADILKRVIV